MAEPQRVMRQGSLLQTIISRIVSSRKGFKRVKKARSKSGVHKSVAKNQRQCNRVTGGRGMLLEGKQRIPDALDPIADQVPLLRRNLCAGVKREISGKRHGSILKLFANHIGLGDGA